MDECYHLAHEEARNRFLTFPSKCYQRHIREVWADREPHEQIPSLTGARVERITKGQAESIIMKYEWLASQIPPVKNPMGRGIQACYGLFLGKELIGANCLGTMGMNMGNICGKYLKKTGYLMRGACAPYSPSNSASFLTRHTCRLAFQDFGWKVFFAYSDSEAGEMGTIYQACGWYYLGEGLGRPPGTGHSDFLSPNGDEVITSYMLNHGTQDERIKTEFGWDGRKGMKRETLRKKGWKEIVRMGKKKWAWFEGTPIEKKKMADACRRHLHIKKKEWPLPYPKRAV
jgi:hypothetical protein